MTSAIQRFQNFIRINRKIYKASALDRLHNHNRLIMLLAYFKTLSTLYPCIFIIHIIKLNLHEFNFWMLRQNHIQIFRIIVKWQPNVFDFSLCL